MSVSAAYTHTPLKPDWRRRYQLLNRIGSGGTAEVYEAWDAELERPVALKVIDERRGLSARVLREVQAAASLAHEGIVSLLDCFTDGERSYLVWELVDGETLAVAGPDLGDARAVGVMAQVLDAVAHAHGQGVVHRDVKPQNIMVRPNGRAMVMDFGLARLADTDTLTGEGDMLGTVAYMSPEQAAGRRVGPASDVYSAGLVLFELLAGLSPVRGATPAETISNIVGGRVLPLEAARPDLPLALLDAVAAALAPAPSQRPTAAEFAAVLHELQRGGELSRRRPLAEGAGRFQLAAERFGGAALGGAAAYAVLDLLPAYPGAWAAPLAVTVAAAWALLPGAGFALLLGALVFPLFNVSLSIGGLYLVAALAGLLTWRDRPACAVWPVAALLLSPLYLTLAAPAAAAALGRFRGPLTAAWAGAATSLYLTFAGAAGHPFAGFAPAGDLAERLAAAGDPLTALGRLVSVACGPASLAQMATWAALAAALRFACTLRRPEQRLWVWAAAFGQLFAAAALVPAALGRQVGLGSLLVSVAAGSVVVVLALVWPVGGLRWRRGAASGRSLWGIERGRHARRGGKDKRVQEDRAQA